MYDEQRIIPNFTNYRLSQSGEVYNVKLNRWVQGSSNPAGYFNYRLTDDNGKVCTLGRHRLLGMVFLNTQQDMDFSTLHINHKNGLKGDDRLENIEWLTAQGNCEHAGQMNLSSKCLPMQVRDYTTGVITNFPSYIECARFYGFSKDHVAHWCNKGPEYASGNLQFRSPQSSVDWPINPIVSVYNNTGTNVYKPSLKNRVYVFCLKTSKEYMFNSIIEAATFIGVSDKSLSPWLDIPGQPVLPGLYLAQRGEYKDFWRPVLNPYSEVLSFQNRKVINVKNIANNDVRQYETVQECANDLGISCDAVKLRIYRETIINNLSISYY